LSLSKHEQCREGSCICDQIIITIACGYPSWRTPVRILPVRTQPHDIHAQYIVHQSELKLSVHVLICENSAHQFDRHINRPDYD
jgi:hypothetical protein